MCDEATRLNTTTRTIIAGAFAVANGLGPGFLEKVYENALAHELRKSRLAVHQQAPIAVTYDGVVVGDYIADLLVEQSVIIEVKAVKALEDVHFAQCLNYLKATDLPICLLINFATPKVQVKRLVGASFKRLSGS